MGNIVATFECKNCGATLDVEPGATVVTCEYCHSTQTLPRLDDGKRAGLFERGNELRRAYEFDRAREQFEKILGEDTGDAEAYWSLALCRYGIVYVEDPRTHDMVPTVNRMQSKSLLTDPDYKQAIKYAEVLQRDVYEKQAKQIVEIQQRIAEVAAKEKPYDVFVCYKDSDAAGARTEDSVIAGDIYDALTRDNLRVFYSRETLKGKLGSDFESYIFAALHSASVMVVVGTRKDYLESPWVKNEWSRYLALCEENKNLILVPAFKGMVAGDLPDEFRSIQAQDLSVLGGMQDLVRYIKTRCSEAAVRNGNQSRPSSQAGFQHATSASRVQDFSNTGVSSSRSKNRATRKAAAADTLVSVESLVDRMNIFLEDADFESASSYADRVLDADPKNVDAYMALALCDEEVTTREEFYGLEELALHNENFDKAVRFSKEGSDIRHAYDELADAARLKARSRVLDSEVISDSAVTEYFAENGDKAAVFEQNMVQALKAANTQGRFGGDAKPNYPGISGVICASREAARLELKSELLRDAADLYEILGDDKETFRCAKEAKEYSRQAIERDKQAWKRKVDFINGLLRLIDMQSSFEFQNQKYGNLKERLLDYGKALTACKASAEDDPSQVLSKQERLGRVCDEVQAMSFSGLSRLISENRDTDAVLNSIEQSLSVQDLWFAKETCRAIGSVNKSVANCLKRAGNIHTSDYVNDQSDALFDPAMGCETFLNLIAAIKEWDNGLQSLVDQLNREKNDLYTRLDFLSKENEPFVKRARQKQKMGEVVKKTVGSPSAIFRTIKIVVVVIIALSLVNCSLRACQGSGGSGSNSSPSSSGSIKVDSVSDASIKKWLMDCDSDGDGTVTSDELKSANIQQIDLEGITDDSALSILSDLPVKQRLIVDDISSPSFNGDNLPGMTSLAVSLCESSSIDLTACSNLETINLGINTDDLDTLDAWGLEKLNNVILDSEGGQRTVKKIDLHDCEKLGTVSIGVHVEELDVSGCGHVNVNVTGSGKIDKVVKGN